MSNASPTSSSTANSSSSLLTKIVTDSPSLAVIIGASITAVIVGICGVVWGVIIFLNRDQHIDETPHGRPDGHDGSEARGSTTQTVNIDDVEMVWDAGVAYPASALSQGGATMQESVDRSAFSTERVRGSKPHRGGTKTTNTQNVSIDVNQADEAIQDDMSASVLRAVFSPELVRGAHKNPDIQFVGETSEWNDTTGTTG